MIAWPRAARWQDHWVIETLRGLRGGCFVNVGASNGVISSNT